MRRIPGRIHCSSMAFVVAATFWWSAVEAQTLVHFDLPAQSLAESLRAIGTATKIDIGFSTSQVAGLSAPALRGDLTVDGALSRVLTGTGLRLQHIDDHFIVLVAVDSSTADVAPKKSDPSGKSIPVEPAKAASQTMNVVKDSSKLRFAQVEPSAPSDASSAEAGERRKELDELVVTGTHLKGVTDSPSPVQIYTREDIERSGSGTIAQFMQTIPQNYISGGASQNATLSAGGGIGNSGNAVGATGINLRGLGTDATLTLVDGHRVAAGNDAGNIVDISMIPANAVERIEVVTDGASAIYGSDAVGGVVNIILRKSFEGAETSGRYATASGTHEVSAGQTLGHVWGDGSAFLSYEYYEQTPLSAADRSYSQTALLPFTLLPEQKRNSVFGSIDQSIASSVSLFANGSFSSRSSAADNATLGVVNDNTQDINTYGGTAGGRARLSDKTEVEVSTTYTASRTTLQGFSAVMDSATENVHADSSILTIDPILRGTLWSMPAGPLLYAVGGQFRRESFDSTDLLAMTEFHPTRNIGAGFVELRIPVIGGDHRLELSVADRYEHYSDFGSTNDPQFGVIWQAMSDLKFRGTYGRSFVAPLLSSLNPTPTFVAAFNTSSFPGTAPASGNVNALPVEGGNPGLEPQTADTWTAGADWKPQSIPGFAANLTYYGMTFNGRISNVFSSGITDIYALANAAVLGPQIAQFNPPSSLVQRLLSSPSLEVLPGADISDITAIINTEDLNLTKVRTDGLDLDISYRREIGAGYLELGAASTYILQFDQNFTSASPTLSVVNTLYNPTKFKTRIRGVFSSGALTGAVFVNYVSAYQNISTAPPTPIASWTTIDLTGTYECKTCSGAFKGLRATVGVLNLLNRNPPFVANAVPAYPINFDGNNANPLGRDISLQLTKVW